MCTVKSRAHLGSCCPCWAQTFPPCQPSTPVCPCRAVCLLPLGCHCLQNAALVPRSGSGLSEQAQEPEWESGSSGGECVPDGTRGYQNLLVAVVCCECLGGITSELGLCLQKMCYRACLSVSDPPYISSSLMALPARWKHGQVVPFKHRESNETCLWVICLDNI